MPGKRGRPPRQSQQTNLQVGVKVRHSSSDKTEQPNRSFERQSRSSDNPNQASLTKRFRYVKPDSNRPYKNITELENGNRIHYSCPSSEGKPAVEDDNIEGSVLNSNGRDKTLEILIHFDHSREYGPCTGLTRMERWIKATKMQLNPPDIIPRLIDKYQGDAEIENGIWHKYGIF